MTATRHIRLGLGPNLAQFALLVVVNAFVGAMVGLERTILPAIAEHAFPHAIRILARAWCRVIWHCWQSRVPYDPARHRAACQLSLPSIDQEAA